MFQATVATLCLLCATTVGIERDVPKKVVQGDIRCRVLLIDFEDRPHQHSREVFEKFILGDNVHITPDGYKQPMIGSARDHYAELSDGRVRISGEVMPWVRSRIRAEDLPHWRKTHDGGRDWWQPVVSDAMSLNNIPKDDRINGKPVNFYVIIYSGPRDGYFKCLKKRQPMGAGQRYLSSSAFRKTKVPYWEDRWNGKKIIFCPERWREEPSGLFGIGLIFHEMGHAIGHFWDLYGDLNDNFDRWAFMGLGEKTQFPTGPSAFNLYIAGWLAYDVPQQRGTHRIVLPPIDAHRAVKLVNGPMPWADALIVEHQVRLSPYQTTLPGEGLLVYQAYGNRRVRTVTWNPTTNKPAVQERRFRIVRADGTPANPAGDAFREGGLSLFGTPSAASSATGCGFWELSNIRVPKPSKEPSKARLKSVATFNAKYCPRHVVIRNPGEPIELGRWLTPGDYRFYVEVAKGVCTLEGKNATLLQVSTPLGGKPQWGLVDVHVPAGERIPLRLVPGAASRLASAQVVDRRPVLLNLLAEPYAQQLVSGLQGTITASTPLAKNVSVGGAITATVKKSTKATVSMKCPGGMLRLALQASTPKKNALPTITLVVREGGKERKYLSKVELSDVKPEFFTIDCNDLRGKSIDLTLEFRGPSGSRIVLWEAGFAAEGVNVKKAK